MRRFFAENICDGLVTVTGGDVVHIRDVLRMQAGEQCILSVEGADYVSEIEEIGRDYVIFRVFRQVENMAEPEVDITLYQGVPKGDKMDYIVQKCTEGGIHRIVPVNMPRCVAKLDGKDDKKRVRWQRIAREAVMGFAKNTDNLIGAPGMMVVTTVHGISGFNDDGTHTTVKGDHWESFDAGLAVQTLCLALHEAGLGSVIMGLFDQDAIAELADIPAGEIVSCILAVGYPAEGNHGKAVRKPLEEVLTFR